MSPRNREPTTESRRDDPDVDDAGDEVVPPWPERGPEIAAGAAATTDDVDDMDEVDDTTVPPSPREPIPLPGPDPVPEPLPDPEPDPAPAPIPQPEPDPRPAPDPVPQPEPDPAPEPGPVAEAPPRATGTDEGSPIGTDDVDANDVELELYEQPEAEATTVVGVDADLDADVARADGDDELFDSTDDIDGADDADVAATAALAAAGTTGAVGRAGAEPAPEIQGHPLLPDAGAWEERWTAVQADFVDDPGRSIQQADRLVTEAMEELARILLTRRDTLQAQWRSGAGETPPDTEQLRVAVQGYRRLLFGLLSA